MGCTPIENAPPDVQAEPAPQLEIRNWTTVVQRTGRNRAQVSAAYLSRQSQDQDARFHGDIAVVFFNPAGDTVSHLSAQRGLLSASGERMSVAGDVVVISHDGTRLMTDSLRWDRGESRISGDGHVRILRPDGEETGVGFVATSDLKRWTLKEVLTRVTQEGR